MGDHIDIAAVAAACSGLGIAMDTLPRHLRAPAADDAEVARPEELPLALTDAEWAILAPLLPAEPPQADAMSQRELLDKVIWVIARGRRWTALDATHEAVRRKFGRWAHAGVWQQLSADADAAVEAGCALHPQRRLHLQRIAQRAETLAGKRPRSGG